MADGSPLLWNEAGVQAALLASPCAPHFDGLAERTLNGYLRQAFGRELPPAADTERPGLVVAALLGADRETRSRLRLPQLQPTPPADLGEEGFRLRTVEDGPRRFVLVEANTPVGLKHGCQELAFFRIAAMSTQAGVDWPLDVTRKPAFPYRGVYILPCWAAHDSAASWARVLRFHSELTLNRNWFWLAGFPLLPEYGGDNAGVDLAMPGHVESLVDLCRAEGMKFYIGGGWYNWHHAQHAGGSIDRGVQYYLDLVRRFPQVDGLFLEPTGEGSTVDPGVWGEHVAAMRRLFESLWQERPDFEFAIAIGKFNDPAYREALHAIDDSRIYWWWCWGDPLRENALAEHPLVLRWHIVSPMLDYHGSTAPPQPAERPLTGYGTSYDPGQGFGNPWNGWGKLGVDHARDVHPHTMPFFSHQYRFRERCWDPEQSEEAFAARLARRLFDADMPGEAIQLYLTLAAFCPCAKDLPDGVFDRIAAIVDRCRGTGTPRNRDTLERMAEAVEGMRTVRANAGSSG